MNTRLVFLFIVVAVAYSSADETIVNSPEEQPIALNAKAASPRVRDCIQIGNYDGRDFREHRCPLRWYVAGLQFVGHQNQESAYVITCCQDV